MDKDGTLALCISGVVAGVHVKEPLGGVAGICIVLMSLCMMRV